MERSGRYTAPYTFSMDVSTEPTGAWPGQHKGSGTYVEFQASRRLFNSVTLGVSGQQSFDRTLEYLAEDLGFIYAEIMTASLSKSVSTAIPCPP